MRYEIIFLTLELVWCDGAARESKGRRGKEWLVRLPVEMSSGLVF